jgi:uncharacterized protein YpmB
VDGRIIQRGTELEFIKRVFTDGQWIELNSTNVDILKQVVSNLITNPSRNKIFFNQLSEEHYTQYVDEKLENLQIQYLGIQGLNESTIEKLFFTLAASKNRFVVLGLIELSDAAVKIIYNHILVFAATNLNLKITVFCGTKIEPVWQRKFDGLLDRNTLLKELIKLSGLLLQAHMQNRYAYLNAHLKSQEEIKSLRAAAEAELKKSADLSQVNEVKLVKTEKELRDALDQQSQVSADNGRLTDELEAAKFKIEAQAKRIAVMEADFSEITCELYTQRSIEKERKKDLLHKDDQIRTLEQKVNHLEIMIKMNNATITELKQTAEAKEESQVNGRKRAKSSPEDSTQLDETSINSAASFLLNIRTSSLSSPEANEAGDEVKPLENSKSVEQVRISLLEKLLSVHGLSKTEAALRVLIETQINTCQSFLAEGVSFAQLSTKQVDALVYYICFLLCDVNQFKKTLSRDAPLSLVVDKYLSQKGEQRIDTRESLLLMVSRMIDHINSITNANMLHRVDQMKMQAELFKIRNEKEESSARLNSLAVLNSTFQEKLIALYNIYVSVFNQMPFLPHNVHSEFLQVFRDLGYIQASTSPTVAQMASLSLNSPPPFHLSSAMSPMNSYHPGLFNPASTMPTQMPTQAVSLSSSSVPAPMKQ